jgi:hypothetical protein
VDGGDEHDGEEPEEEGRGRTPGHDAGESVRPVRRGGGGAHARSGVHGWTGGHTPRATRPAANPPSEPNTPWTEGRYPRRTYRRANATDRSY